MLPPLADMKEMLILRDFKQCDSQTACFSTFKLYMYMMFSLYYHTDYHGLSNSITHTTTKHVTHFRYTVLVCTDLHGNDQRTS